MYLRTLLSTDHLELIKVFVEANELHDTIVMEVAETIRGIEHCFLHLKCDNLETETKLSYMGFRHCGVLNMLDDYLLKCGVPVNALQPKSFNRQLQNEKEEETNRKFLDSMFGVK